MLAGKTVLITGSARGIGREIALRCARDGANVVIAAKTIEPDSHCPNTIYTVAREVNELGGKGLAVYLDLRDEQSIKEAIVKTVRHFGGIDVLINNASAISLSVIEDTPLKRYDIMHDINARGTFAMSKYAIPHLLQSSNPHILNISPPIELKRCLFENNTAYTMSKYGMSLCMYGLASQFAGRITVNAVWPKTSIWTSTTSLRSHHKAGKVFHKPSIMADAVYVIITKNSFTCYSGLFLLDEEVLQKEGITNFDQYKVRPPSSSPILHEYQLDQNIANNLPQFLCMDGRELASSEPSRGPMSAKEAERIIDALFDEAFGFMTDEICDSINGVLKIVITDYHLEYVLIIRKGIKPFVTKEATTEKPDVTLYLDFDTFLGNRYGRINPISAYMSGRVKVKGKMNLAIKLEKIFSRELKSRL